MKAESRAPHTTRFLLRTAGWIVGMPLGLWCLASLSTGGSVCQNCGQSVVSRGLGLTDRVWGQESLPRGLNQLLNRAPDPKEPVIGQAQDLIAFSVVIGDGRQQITVIDPRQRAISVYHVINGTGEISLQSVRNIRLDLEIEDFNSGEPSPHDIRAMKAQSE